MMSGSKGNGTPYEDAIRLYPSWVKTLNHYSDLVLRIRITAITSGIIILAAAGTLLLKERNLLACQLVCIFGVFFSIVLWTMLHNYYEHYSNWLDLVIDVEKEMELPDTMCTWTLYKIIRERRGRCYKWIVRYGCIALITLAAIAILVLSLTVDFGEEKNDTDVRASQESSMKHKVDH